MTEYQLYQKLKEVSKALGAYQKQNKSLSKLGIWYDDIQKLIPEIVAKTHILGAGGRPCSRCGGSGVEG